MADLITLADAQASLANLTAAQVASLPGVISAASRACEGYCARALALAGFDEEYAPGTTRIVRLKNYPVASVSRVAADLSAAISIQAIPGPWRATIALTPDPGLALTLVGGATPGTTTLLFEGLPAVAASAGPPPVPASAAVPPIPDTATLAATISAIPGWTATVPPGMAACPPTEYRPIQGAVGCLAEPATILAYSVDLNRWDLDENTGKLTLYDIRPEPYSYPARTWGIAGGYAKVRVLYQAGFAAVPDDAAEACRVTVQAMLDRRLASGVYRSESLGNTSYELAEMAAIPPAAMQLLARYRSRRLA